MGVHRAYLPIGDYGPYPERLRQQFEGVIWRFETGSPWREMPQEFGAWVHVHNRFRQWRDAGVFEALLEGVIAEATSGARWTLVGLHLRASLIWLKDLTRTGAWGGAVPRPAANRSRTSRNAAQQRCR